MQHIDLEKLANTPNVIESICNWNAARYKQEYNHDLNVKLIKEEFNEGLEAFGDNNLVELADSYGDQFYVAIGAIWKQGGVAETINPMLDYLDRLPMPPLPVILEWVEARPSPVAYGFYALTAFEALTKLCIDDSDAALDIIRAICISNDSKPAKKTPSHVKANVDKGDSYVAPTKAIEAILIRKGVL